MNDRKNKILRLIFFVTAVLITKISIAHNAPTTNVILSVSPNLVLLELQLPIQELELSFKKNLSQNPETILKKYERELRKYILNHIHAYKIKENPWKTEILEIKVDNTIDILNNVPIWELIVQIKIVPTSNENTRNFIIDYDVIQHEVINHIAYIYIKSDWENGVFNHADGQIGIISRDISSNKIYPFKINLEYGSRWKGFKSMFSLGMQHIKEGSDHLLFIITLLIPACLLTYDKKWATVGSTKYTLKRLARIITAFTIGHSITLLIGAFNVLSIPTQLIEIVIAISILFSAIHAIRPLFYKKETYIALGFGLIHGLAFSQTLTAFLFNPLQLALSILGFNLGIEVMQLFIIAITIPWFIILGMTPYFRFIRISFSIIVIIAALGWTLQRITNENNFITKTIDKSLQFSHWMILGFAITSLLIFTLTRRKSKIKLQNLCL